MMPILSYLKLSIHDEDTAAFERDLEEMLKLAPRQPGFESQEVYQLRGEPSTYLVLSQWESVDHLRAWEHSPKHEEVIRRNEPRFRQSEVHQRYVPWQRPM